MIKRTTTELSIKMLLIKYPHIDDVETFIYTGLFRERLLDCAKELYDGNMYKAAIAMSNSIGLWLDNMRPTRNEVERLYKMMDYAARIAYHIAYDLK